MNVEHPTSNNEFCQFKKKTERSDSTLRHSVFVIRYSAVRFFNFCVVSYEVFRRRIRCLFLVPVGWALPTVNSWIWLYLVGNAHPTIKKFRNVRVHNGYSNNQQSWFTPLTWGGKNTHTGALNFYPIFIPLLSVRFQVSVFRICDCVYLSWHLNTDTWNHIRGTKTV